MSRNGWLKTLKKISGNMSIWGNIREKSLGQSVRLEEQTEEIKNLAKAILDNVVQYNDLANELDSLSEQCGQYEDFDYPLYSGVKYRHYDDTTVNETLKSHDLEKMRKLGRDIMSGIFKFKKEKTKLEQELAGLEKREQERRKMFWEKLEQEKKEAEEKKRHEKEAEDRKLAIKFFINLAISILIAVAAGISCAQNGEPVWGGALIGGGCSFFAGLFIIGKSENF